MSHPLQSNNKRKKANNALQDFPRFSLSLILVTCISFTSITLHRIGHSKEPIRALSIQSQGILYCMCCCVLRKVLCDVITPADNIEIEFPFLLILHTKIYNTLTYVLQRDQDHFESGRKWSVVGSWPDRQPTWTPTAMKKLPIATRSPNRTTKTFLSFSCVFVCVEYYFE